MKTEYIKIRKAKGPKIYWNSFPRKTYYVRVEVGFYKGHEGKVINRSVFRRNMYEVQLNKIAFSCLMPRNSFKVTKVV